MKIPNRYLKVQIFTYIDENLAMILVLQTTFQNQDIVVISVRDVLPGSRVRLVYFFLINFKLCTYLLRSSSMSNFRKVLNISCHAVF